MKNNANQNLQAKEVKVSKTLFDSNINYEEPANDRPYIFRVGKTPLYVNLDQLRFLKEEYWQEKTENWMKSRCLIPAKRGKLKICRGDCLQCSIWRNGMVKPTFVSLTEIDEEKFLADSHQKSILDILIEEEKRQLMYKAIDNLKNPIDRYIMRQYLLKKTDEEVAKILKKTRQTIINHRKQCMKEIKKFIKKHKIFLHLLS